MSDWKAKRRGEVLELLSHWKAVAKDRCTRCLMKLHCPGLEHARKMVADLEEELQELGK